MKINIQIKGKFKSGYALIIATIFSAIGVFILTGALQWTSTNSKLIERNNQYFSSVAAAEAATEQVIAQLSYDFNYKGQVYVDSKLSDYNSICPNMTPFKNFNFTNAKDPNKTFVEKDIANSGVYTNLDPRYSGLFGFASLYRIISNASEKNTRQTDVIAAVKQDVWLTTIPVFQMAAFSTGDLEINPGANMTISGRVHSNSNIYFQPNGVKLTFLNDVTAVGDIINDKKLGDPSKRAVGKYEFGMAHDSRADSLNLPIGTNNTPDAVHAILEIPPVGEDANSVLGQQRYYNKADLHILLSSTGLVVRATATGTNLSTKQITNFISTNITFYNSREQKTVKGIEIDVAKFKQFAETDTTLKKLNVNAIYVADTRKLGKDEQTGVRLINGQRLPDQGLTVATLNPLYVKGDYNITDGSGYSLSTSNTAYTRPASLVADAITILSSKWNDANSTKSVSNRGASNTTVNAAILAGNVETKKDEYSGGLENFPRFLEDWDDVNTFTYNGSMVMMFKSKIATAPWGADNVYVPPTRRWSFDQNFLQPMKLPPETPRASRAYRKQWDVIAPKKTS